MRPQINSELLSFILSPEPPAAPLCPICDCFFTLKSSPSNYDDLICRNLGHVFEIRHNGTYLTFDWKKEKRRFYVWMDFKNENLSFTIYKTDAWTQTIVEHQFSSDFSDFDFLDFEDLISRMELYMLLS